MNEVDSLDEHKDTHMFCDGHGRRQPRRANSSLKADHNLQRACVSVSTLGFSLHHQLVRGGALTLRLNRHQAVGR